MENKWQLQAQDIQIQGLLDNFLKLRSADNYQGMSKENHLSDDSLAAFVEGNLNQRETKPIVSHLVDCSFCRHVTAELVKLDYAFAETEEIRGVNTGVSEPSRISEVLNGLLARIFGSNDGAVFAHEEKEENSEQSEKANKDEDLEK
jgi:hypothetical protein